MNEKLLKEILDLLLSDSIRSLYREMHFFTCGAKETKEDIEKREELLERLREEKL